MIYKNNKKVIGLFKGSQEVFKAFKGTQLVYQKGSGSDYLKFTSWGESHITYVPSSVSTAEFSLDGGESWQSFDNVMVSLNPWEEMLVRGTISGNQEEGNCAHFTGDGQISLSGNLMSLAFKDNYANVNTIPYDFCFAELFAHTNFVDDALELKICNDENTILSPWCYASMFKYCENMHYAPLLPSLNLAEGCYNGMFSNTPDLSASGGIILPAETLAPKCYKLMFRESGIDSITIQCTSLAEECFYGMLNGCQNLFDIVLYEFAGTWSTSAAYHWLNNVAGSGTIHTNMDMTGMPNDDISGCPSGWSQEYW